MNVQFNQTGRSISIVKNTKQRKVSEEVTRLGRSLLKIPDRHVEFSLDQGSSKGLRLHTISNLPE